MADVERAKKEAQSEAVDYALAIMFTALRDKEGWNVPRLQRLWDEINDVADSVAQGYVNIADLQYTLRTEAGIVFEK